MAEGVVPVADCLSLSPRPDQVRVNVFLSALAVPFSLNDLDLVNTLLLLSVVCCFLLSLSFVCCFLLSLPNPGLRSLFLLVSPVEDFLSTTLAELFLLLRSCIDNEAPISFRFAVGVVGVLVSVAVVDRC